MWWWLLLDLAAANFTQALLEARVKYPYDVSICSSALYRIANIRGSCT
jgi:hypothetical protein